MLIIAIFLFFIAAIFGLIILTAMLQDKPAPKPAVYIHGSIATIALLLVIIYIFITGSSPLLLTSLILFTLAALGGRTLSIIDPDKKNIRKLLAVIHPLIAAAGLFALIIYVLP